MNSIIFFICSLSFHIHFSSFIHFIWSCAVDFCSLLDPIRPDPFFIFICCACLHTCNTCVFALFSTWMHFGSHMLLLSSYKSLTTATNVIFILWCDWNNISMILFHLFNDPHLIRRNCLFWDKNKCFHNNLCIRFALVSIFLLW